MAKGSRARANKVPTKVAKSKKQPVKPTCDIPNILKDYPVRTLTTADVNRFKELVTLSNNVAGLLKQCTDTDLSIIKGNAVAKDMIGGKIKGPAMQKITPTLYLPLTDIKGVAKKIKDEIEILKQASNISKGQLSQRYDEYIDSMRGIRRIFDQLLANAPEQELKLVSADRIKKSAKESQIIFEKEVEKLTKEDEDYLKSVKTKIDEKAIACECASCSAMDKKAKIPKIDGHELSKELKKMKSTTK